MPRKLIRIEIDHKHPCIRSFYVKARLENRKNDQRGELPFLKIIERDVEAVVTNSRLDSCAFTVTVGKAWSEDWPVIQEQIIDIICTYVEWVREDVEIERHTFEVDGSTGTPHIERRTADEELDAEVVELVDAPATDDAE